MRTRLTALTIAALLFLPAAASASGQDVIDDCVANEGSFSRTFTAAEYRDALRNLPADVDQYSDCRQAIQDAQREKGLGGSGGSSGSSGSSGSGGSWGGSATPGVPPGVDPLATATPQEKAAIAEAIAEGGDPITLDGQAIDPNKLGSNGINSPLDLPAPLLALVALLVVGIVASATRWSILYVRQRRATR